eukprot:TRINITY_DN18801_c0_g1_i1.p1 TRINITY_DN18801_c0_g1~~TRINITY_DN18801_c0_g1_i1.p1  ORF type:complete len:156 (+),score=19.14 TRINITY_DN18801_c0_g1_i1:75-542(+)
MAATIPGERDRMTAFFLQLARYEDTASPGLYQATLRALRPDEDRTPQEGLRAVAAALISNPTLFQCFQAMLPCGIYLPDDVEPIVYLPAEPMIEFNGSSPSGGSHKKRRKTLSDADGVPRGERELCGVISTRGIGCKQVKTICPYHQKGKSPKNG